MTLAVISVYSSPLPDLLAQSHGTLVSCEYFGDRSITIVDVTCIEAVVAMIPHSPPGIADGKKHFFLVERPGLDIAHLGGIQRACDAET